MEAEEEREAEDDESAPGEEVQAPPPDEDQQEPGALSPRAAPPRPAVVVPAPESTVGKCKLDPDIKSAWFQKFHNPTLNKRVLKSNLLVAELVALRRGGGSCAGARSGSRAGCAAAASCDAALSLAAVRSSASSRSALPQGSWCGQRCKIDPGLKHMV